MKEILRSLRNQKNYSQSAVAEYLEISRQMYNKYENGTAEPSLKNIKKLCDLYKVSADVFFRETVNSNDTHLYKYNSENDSCLYVASPSITYGKQTYSKENKTSLLENLISFLPDLKLSEQISLMSKLAVLIEKQTCSLESSKTHPVINQKKIKKIPDTEYNHYLKSEESKTVLRSGSSTVREILKNDEW